MSFIFNTKSYFLIIHNNKLDITFKSHLFNAILICLDLLSTTKPKTIWINISIWATAYLPLP